MVNFLKYTVFAIFLLTSLQNIAQQNKAQIIVGPNIQVSTDGNFTHGEYMLAANPKDPDNLICISTIFPGMPYSSEVVKNMVYVTNNGGKSWDYSSKYKCKYGGDPQIDFTNLGTTITVSLADVMRSEDKGIKWNQSLCLYDYEKAPFLYGLPMGGDHPQLGIDRTFGNFSGRIYISVMGGTSSALKRSSLNYPLWLFRSEDEGKSFIGPILATQAEKGKGLNTTNLLVSSNGTLFCTYAEWFNDLSLPNSFNGYSMYLVSSKDGGVTFSSPKKVGRNNLDSTGSFFTIFPQYAINNHRDKYIEYTDNYNDKYKDRIYCVYAEMKNGRSVIMFTYSKDEGESWSEPKLVDPNMPDDSYQYQTAIAINSCGIVGVRWFDSRGVSVKKEYNEYFTASLDGGETFLPPVRVSSATSKLPNYKNERVIPIWSRSLDRDSIFMVLKFEESYANDHRQGGDYIQFTSDARGVFHDIWPDCRDGRNFQIYTSSIKVNEIGEDAEKERIEFENKYKIDEKKYTKNAGNKIIGQVSKDVFLSMDAADYDTIKNILSIPVRVRNISSKPIFGPIKVEISKIDSTHGKLTIPLVLNASNKRRGTGAIFNYNLNDKNILLPNQETETLLWKFKVDVPEGINKISCLYLTVKGYTEKSL